MMNKLILTGIVCLLAVLTGKAQDIATARIASVGSTVTFRGVALNGAELANIRYIQDATGGIAIYGSNLSTVSAGDSVLVTGIMTNYNNLVEVTPVTSVNVLASVALPAAQTIADVSTVGEQHESELLKFNNCFFTTGGSTFAGNTNYAVTVNGQTLQVRILNGSPLIGEIIPGGEVSLTGIMSQYCASPETGCTSGYQLLLRTASDIQSSSSISLTSPISVSTIATTSFEIHWSTNIAGTDSYIKYGLTPALELGTIGANDATDHVASLTGLTPATIYYVKAYSWNNADSAVTLERTFATQSLSSGTITAYFNRFTDDSFSSGEDAVFLDHLVADTLAAYIDRAVSTLDICIYNWDDSFYGMKIIDAVNDARARGVKIRVIHDGSTFNSAIGEINSQIRRLETPQGSDYTIMHNKFVIIDANASNPDLPVVWTGSTNFTGGQLVDDANNVIIFQDQSLARGYKMEFDEMWGDTSQTSAANLTLSKFGQFKTDNTPHEYIIGGKRVESYFSPSDHTNAQILRTIATADEDLYFNLFVVTRTDLAYGIKDQIILNSLASKGMIDDAATSASPYGILQPTMGQNLALNGHNWILHHKYMIIDESAAASDPLVVTGSHNWSSAADQKNDENTVIVHDASMANQFYQEFMGRWCERNGLNCFADIQEAIESEKLVVYPNPSAGSFTVAVTGDGGQALLTLTDLAGKCVHTQQVQTINGLNEVSVGNSGIGKGVYLLQWTTAEGQISKRVMID